MRKCLLIMVLLWWGGAAVAQDSTIQLIAPLNPLMVTVPSDWVSIMRWDTDDFRFRTWTRDFVVIIYSYNQHLLEQDGINPNDLDAALKLFPFQRMVHGKRSLTPEGWRHETETISYKGVDILVSDYTHTQTPTLELLRVLDNGFIVLIQVTFEEPGYADLDPIYDVMASARMTEVGEFTCTRADFGAAPVYTQADTTSELFNADEDTAVINYFFTTDAGWFSLQDGGFIRFKDRDVDLFKASECLRVPLAGERILPIDPETVELTEVLQLRQAYTLRYPKDGSWHLDSEGAQHRALWQQRGGSHIQNYHTRVTFNVYNVTLLDHWKTRSSQPLTPEPGCRLEEHYEETQVNDQLLVRYTTVDTCATDVHYHTYLAVQAEDDVLLVADVTPVFAKRPLLSEDTRLIERMLLSLDKRAVGELTCTVAARQDAAIYAAPSEAEQVDLIPENTDVEIQSYTKDAQEGWWMQLTSGDWTRLENLDYAPECDLLPIVQTVDQ